MQQLYLNQLIINIMTSYIFDKDRQDLNKKNEKLDNEILEYFRKKRGVLAEFFQGYLVMDFNRYGLNAKKKRIAKADYLNRHGFLTYERAKEEYLQSKRESY